MSTPEITAAPDSPAQLPQSTRKTLPELAAAPVPELASEAVPTPAGGLRYTGPAPVIVMDLGGEVVPDQVVFPATEELAAALVARGDFKPEN